MIRVIYASKSQGGPVNFFESEFIDQKYQELISTVDLDTRDRILREVGQNLFDEYATLPMFTISSEFVVNPAVVAEYRTSGILPSTALGIHQGGEEIGPQSCIWLHLGNGS